MKRILYFALVVATGLILTGTTASAAEYTRTAASLETNSASLSLSLGATNSISANVSKGVALRYFGVSSAYTAGTLHSNGDREFGTTSTSATIWWDYCTASGTPCGTSSEPTLGAASDTAIGSTWSSL